jgi:two-component system heavy metal sensor histidine kinase CusS
LKSRGIRLRLTAWYSLILALSLCAFGGSSYLAIQHSIRANIVSGLRQHFEGVQKIIEEVAPEGPSALNDELREYADGMGNLQRLRVEDSSGTVYFASRGLEKAISNPKANAGSGLFRAKIEEREYEFLLDSTEAAGKRYDVTLATSLRDYNWAVARFRLILFALVPALLIVAALGGYWMSRSALAPVDEITRAARTIGAEDLGRRLTVHKTGDELQRLADTLNEMLARLEGAFQRVTRFTADASHELRSPVSVMRASAELALRKSRTEEEYREALAQILHESVKVSHLIEQLLILARADSGSAVLPMSPTDLCETVHSACGQAEDMAGSKGLLLSEHLPERTMVVSGDALSLERLFLILLDNAVKYTPAGGKIDVQLSTENGSAVAEVRDTGIGIAEEDLPHVFDRFYRVDRSRSRESGGVGLGLAIGRWIAEAHGGEIRLESTPAKGSIFQVRLPLAPQ